MSAENNRSLPAASSPAAPKRKLPPTLLIVVLLALLGGGVAWLSRPRAKSAEASGSEASSSTLYLFPLESFTVNLSDPEESHFLRVTMDLGIDHLPPRTNPEKSTALLPVARIRDSVITVLTGSHADTLLTPEGKVALKKGIVNALNQAVPEVGVREVYFTEFLVQR